MYIVKRTLPNEGKVGYLKDTGWTYYTIGMPIELDGVIRFTQGERNYNILPATDQWLYYGSYK